MALHQFLGILAGETGERTQTGTAESGKRERERDREGTRAHASQSLVALGRWKLAVPDPTTRRFPLPPTS